MKASFSPIFEKTLVGILLAITAFALMFSQFVEAEIDFKAFSQLTFTGISLIFAGLLYRYKRKDSENIANTLICTGILIAYSNIMSVTNYLFLGLSRKSIDPFLVSIDALLGFHWIEFLEVMYSFPIASALLAIAYQAFLPLLIVQLIVLGFTGRHEALYCFVLSLMLSGIATIGFWAVFPSFGTTVIYTIPDHLELRLKLVVGNEYGNILRDLSRDKIPLITPLNIKGIIAFPSFHTIMALLCTYYAWSLGKWRYLFIVLNVGVIFSVPLHGGHHLIDLLGALVFVILVIMIVNQLRKAWDL